MLKGSMRSRPLISYYGRKSRYSEESLGENSNDPIFALVDGTANTSKTDAITGCCEVLVVDDDDGDISVASVEDQLKKEMIVYENLVTLMLKSLGRVGSQKVHNNLKIFCVADPRYDKSLQQLESFLSGLVAEDKLELIDGEETQLYAIPK